MTSEIYNLVRAEITSGDLDAFKAQAKKMKDATIDERGTLTYDFFINEETKEVLIIEKYADGAAFMAHMNKFTQPEYIPTLLEMQEITGIEMPGSVPDEVKELFEQGGWPYNGYPTAI